MAVGHVELKALGLCIALAGALAACGDGDIAATSEGTAGGTAGSTGSGPGATSGATTSSGSGGSGPTQLVTEETPGFDFFAAVEGEDALGAPDLAAACAVNHDPVATALCASPSITSITELEKAIGLGFLPGLTVSGHNGNPGYSMLMHSTSLSTRLVSPANPRAVFYMSPFTMTSPAQGVAMGYARGEGHAELAGYDAQTNRFNYYLVVFQKAFANTFDRVGPGADSGFTGYSVYTETALANTTLDCQNCHKGNSLLMVGVDAPWIHWAAATDTSNPVLFGPPAQALMNEYRAVHAAPEAYAGVTKIDDNRPQYLQTFLKTYNQDTTQPVNYPSKTIETEVLAGGTSPTWDALYAQVLAVQAMPIPTYNVDPTDAASLAQYTDAYARIVAGTLAPDQLPSPIAVFDPAELPRFSIEAPAGAAPVDILMSMCGSCHSAKLTDPSRVRFKFRVDDLAKMSQAEKDEAVRRIRLAPGTAGHMPPTRFRHLKAAEIDAVTAFLSQ